MKKHAVESRNERKSDLELIQALHTIENDHVDQSLHTGPTNNRK